MGTKHSARVSVALVFRDAESMRHIILVSVATVLCSASLRSFLRVILRVRSPKGPRSAATVYSQKTLSMRFCLFIAQLTVV